MDPTKLPPHSDGRDIDESLAELIGEAAHQQVKPADEHLLSVAQPWETLPVPRADDPSYYDRPMLKAPVWKPFVPLYYFTGGATGACLALGAAAQMQTSGRLARLVRRCRHLGVAGSALSAALLIADLGRPGRFLYMLRVFRPTSPMNMGAWILAGASGTAFTAAMLGGNKSSGFRRIGETAGFASGLFGAALATYTGVLVSTTAIPVWQESRRVLPVLFGASAAASSGALLDLLSKDNEASRVTRFFSFAGRAAELGASYAMERHVLAAAPRVGEPLRRGLSGALWKSARALTAASLITSLLPRQTRKKRILAGALGAAGSLALRFATHQAGVASARDPRAAFHQQRAAHGPDSHQGTTGHGPDPYQGTTFSRADDHRLEPGALAPADGHGAQ